MTAATPEPPATLAGALAALQAVMPPVGKHATADVKKDGKKLYDYAYAPGEAITPVLYPLMAAVGLSFTASPSVSSGRFVLSYALLHTSGEQRTGEYPLPDPDRYGPQDLGKAITYARRYALCALVGLFPGGDDNDAGDMKEQARPARQPRTADAKRAETRPPHQRAGASHERIVQDRAGHDPAKTTRTKGQQVSGTDDDPWARDAPVDGHRAAALRESIPTSDPEDLPGSILPGQVTAIAIMLKRLGYAVDDRDGRHEALCNLLALPAMPPHPTTGAPSTHGLSYTQAADAIKMLQESGAPV